MRDSNTTAAAIDKTYTGMRPSMMVSVLANGHPLNTDPPNQRQEWGWEDRLGHALLSDALSTGIPGRLHGLFVKEVIRKLPESWQMTASWIRLWAAEHKPRSLPAGEYGAEDHTVNDLGERLIGQGICPCCVARLFLRYGASLLATHEGEKATSVALEELAGEFGDGPSARLVDVCAHDGGAGERL